MREKAKEKDARDESPRVKSRDCNWAILRVPDGTAETRIGKCGVRHFAGISKPPYRRIVSRAGRGAFLETSLRATYVVLG